MSILIKAKLPTEQKSDAGSVLCVLVKVSSSCHGDQFSGRSLLQTAQLCLGEVMWLYMAPPLRTHLISGGCGKHTQCSRYVARICYSLRTEVYINVFLYLAVRQCHNCVHLTRTDVVQNTIHILLFWTHSVICLYCLTRNDSCYHKIIKLLLITDIIHS